MVKKAERKQVLKPRLRGHYHSTKSRPGCLRSWQTGPQKKETQRRGVCRRRVEGIMFKGGYAPELTRRPGNPFQTKVCATMGRGYHIARRVCW